MVLTDRQRAELHAGIYAYLQTRGESFAQVAEALAIADPSVLPSPESENSEPSSSRRSSTSGIPILEKKWTAVPRLQKKVLELERALAQAARSGGLGVVPGGGVGGASAVGPGGVGVLSNRRMLPRAPCAHTLQGHSNTVLCVVVHPVFTVACSGSDDATIKVWDHESGEYMKTLKGHTGPVLSLSFTPNGTHLASASSDLSIKLWDFKTYNCIRTLRGHDHTISSICFIPSPPSLPPTSSTTPTINTGTTTSTTGMDVTSAGSAFLVSASRDKTVKVWELETGFCVNTLQDHLDWVRCLSVRMDGQFLASSGSDFNIQVYKIKNSSANAKMGEDMTKLCELRGHEHVVETVAFVTRAPQSSAVPNTNGGTDAPKLTSAAKRMKEAENYLASGARDRTVRLWDIAAMECIAVFSSHENWVRSVIIHPSGNYIISCGDDRTIRVLDIKSNRCLRTIDNAHQHFVTSLSMHYSLPILVSGGVDHMVKCWSLD